MLALHHIVVGNHTSNFFELLLSEELQLIIQVLDPLSLGWQHKSECVIAIVCH